MTQSNPTQNPNRNVLYAQAGGVTAVINASAAGVIESCKRHSEVFGKIYAAQNGIEGILAEKLIDLSQITQAQLQRLKTLPSAAFDACRFDLDPIEKNPAQYKRVLAVFKHYQIGYFFYNGGNGSMITAQKVADYCTAQGHPVTCIGIAKTIDNDLALSHCSPGFGSAAKYIATSLLEATMDLHAMHRTSTKFFALEAMGRNAGWLALAGGLIKTHFPQAPLIILPAERPFNPKRFLQKVDQYFQTHGYCVCIASEGLKNEQDQYLAIEGIEHTQYKDYTQLGGVAHTLAQMVRNHFHCKTHHSVPDYLQRSASHLVSAIDWEMAYQAGSAAVDAALSGKHGVIPIIEQVCDDPFIWHYKTVKLTEVANLEKRVPDTYITEDGMDITQAGLNYLLPLIQGERSPIFKNGLPDIQPLDFKLVPPALPHYAL